MASTANKNLKFPLQVDLSAGYFELTQTTLDTIKQNLVMIIASDENERVVKPHIGSRFRSFLFEQNVQVLKSKCENEINRIFDTFFPYLNLEEAGFDIDTSNPLNQNVLKMNLTYSLKKIETLKETISVSVG